MAGFLLDIFDLNFNFNKKSLKTPRCFRRVKIQKYKPINK